MFYMIYAFGLFLKIKKRCFFEQVPAAVYSQLTMNTWLGRRLNLSACFLLSGIVLLSALFVPKGIFCIDESFLFYYFVIR